MIKHTGFALTLVYVGNSCLLHFPTDQEAWEYLSRLLRTADEKELPWPEEVYITFVVEESDDKILIPQINKIVKQDGKLQLRGLFGPRWDKFHQRITDDWPSIREGLDK
jgi:hypothetical protein